MLNLYRSVLTGRQNSVFTKQYRTERTDQGFRFVFYCDLGGDSYRTKECITDSFAEALKEGCGEARQHFNMCHACGRWVSDKKYNETEMQCILCAPKKTVCRLCGKTSMTGDGYCTNCGEKIKKEDC